MRLFRIAKKNYIEDLSGEGARLFGGRWNKRGTNMLYFSTSLSLCVLEVLVHFNQDLAPSDLYFIEIDVPDKLINDEENFIEISEYLRVNPPHHSTQNYGTNWADEGASLGLKVPSAILPLENNVIINPKHSEFKKIKIIRSELLNLDARVFL